MAAFFPRTLASAQANERARLFRAVAEGRVGSRKEISDLFALRSSTVSELVGDLLEAGLLAETQARSGGRGRPAHLLVANPNRLAVIVFRVASQSVRAAAVNLAGQAIATESADVPVACDNDGMAVTFRDLGARIMSRIPGHAGLAGMSFSLSGVVDTASQRWLFSSRWPRLQSLDVGQAVQGLNLPVVVSRNLDVELGARLARSDDRAGGTLLLHWGYGIGASFALDGIPVNGGEGRFGEIGHCRVSAAGAAPCRCGRSGCLETLASLWALQPALSDRWPLLEIDEAALARQVRTIDLLSLPAMDRAVDQVVVALANLCRILFPRRIILSGPFVANPRLWAEFHRRFQAEGVLTGVEAPDLLADQRSGDLELEGAASSLLTAATARLLTR